MYAKIYNIPFSHLGILTEKFADLPPRRYHMGIKKQ